MIGFCHLWFSLHPLFVTIWFISIQHLQKLFTNTLHRGGRNWSAVNEPAPYRDILPSFPPPGHTFYPLLELIKLRVSWPNHIWTFSISKKHPKQKGNVQLQESGEIQSKYRLSFPIFLYWNYYYYFCHPWKTDLSNYMPFNKRNKLLGEVILRAHFLILMSNFYSPHPHTDERL